MEFGTKPNTWHLKEGDTLIFKFSETQNKAGEVLRVMRNKVLVMVNGRGIDYKMKVSRPFIIGAWQAEKNKEPAADANSLIKSDGI